MGRLTTHVLDTYHGGPAAHMAVQLWELRGNEDRALIKAIETNADGRADSPLLEDDALHAGDYELCFFVRDYFREKGHECPFLSVVPVRFTVFDAVQHYHVPLLVSPWAYSTYRGS